MTTRHIFIDDSGNLRNTKILIICFVVCENKEHTKEIESSIQHFKRLRFKDTSIELHFNKESFSSKKEFFEHIRNEKFLTTYYIATSRDKDTDYIGHIICSLIENSNMIRNAKVYIDGNSKFNKNHYILQRIKKALLAQNIRVASLRFLDSNKNELIQLADMCAGCIRRKLERNTVDDNKLYDLIRKFIIET